MIEKESYAQKKEKCSKIYHIIQSILFFTILFIGCGVSFLMPLRPSVSDLEKRTLTEFPKFSKEAFWDGSYFKEMDTWFADTFPFRDQLLSINSDIQELYGIRGEQIHGGGNQSGDEIPVTPMTDHDSNEEESTKTDDKSKDKEETTKSDKSEDKEETTKSDKSEDKEETTKSDKSEDKEETTKSDKSEDKEETTKSDKSEDKEETTKSDKSEDKEETTKSETTEEVTNDNMAESTIAPQVHGSIYVDGRNAYGIYYFSLDAANLYIDTVNRMAAELKGEADVYAMLIPNNSGVLLSEKKQKELGGSSQTDAIDYYYNSMSKEVKTVSIFDSLLKHKEEPIFFATDHHWTALGAYYSYEQFAKEKGIKAHKLDDYDKVSFPDFVGSYYSSTQAKELKENPEVVDAYIPLAVNQMLITEKNGNQLKWPIINDVSTYQPVNKYSCFIGGDNPYSVIENPKLKDGSTCLVVKESFGNAFVPFLVDHYQKVIVVDYRYYTGNLITLAKENHVTDVIFANNIEAISGVAIMEKLNGLVQ